MKTNGGLQANFQNTFNRGPLLHAAEVSSILKNGGFFLAGVADGYANKATGVTAPGSPVKTDAEIAVEVAAVLNTNWSVPKNKVTVQVEAGWVTLEGELPWKYQSEAAQNAVHYMAVVKGVTNNIKIKSETQYAIEKKDVEDAIAGSWSMADSDINVSVSGTTIILSGAVNSWYQKEEAGRVAWNIPGILLVKNKLAVDLIY